MLKDRRWYRVAARVLRILFSTATLLVMLLIALIVIRLSILAPRLGLAVVVFLVFILIAMVLSSIFRLFRTFIKRP